MNKRRFGPEDQEVLTEVINHIIEGTMSSRKAAAYLGSATGKSISHEGLLKIVKRYTSTVGNQPGIISSE